MKFTRDFVDSCHPSLSRAPNPHPSLQTRVGGVSFLVVGAPPLYSVNRHPLPRPQTQVGGGFLLSFLPPPTPPSAAPRVNAPGLCTASTPLACVPRQCPRPACHINTPGLCAASTPPACAPRQRPQPARRVNAPALCAVSMPLACALHQPLLRFPCTPCLCIDTPAWAVSMPSPVQEEGSPPLALDKL